LVTCARCALFGANTPWKRPGFGEGDAGYGGQQRERKGDVHQRGSVHRAREQGQQPHARRSEQQCGEHPVGGRRPARHEDEGGDQVRQEQQGQAELDLDLDHGATANNRAM
jgi:hypothetical protein